MEPLLSNVSKDLPNGPRDLQSRLYREIGISAVVAALEVSNDALRDHATPERRREILKARAA